MNMYLSLAVHVGLRCIHRRLCDKLFIVRAIDSRLCSTGITLRNIRYYFGCPSPRVLICGGLLASNILKCAQCKARRSADRVSASTLHRPGPSIGRYGGKRVVDLKTPWGDIWRLILLNAGYVIAAVATAVLAAVVNIKLPLLLGDIVNVVASIRHDPDALNALAPVAVRLVALYVAQGVLTCVYISVLSILGERLATHLRTRLFRSLITQDIAFFDSHRTGELVARLSADVQEFKSAFKQCVSQGLRCVTQTVGCVISLYLISPKMTGITVAILPCIIAFGAALGSFLRQLSRRAQAQVAVATSVADEALSNIRTVRAFAMEDAEDRLFQIELEKAQHLNEILGLGIGVFQGAANCALNGIVLGVIYGGSQLISAHELSAGQLTSFLVTAQTIQRSLAQLSLLFGHAVKGMSAGARVFEYIHLRPTLPVQGGAIIPYHSLMGEVRFDNVRFAYPTRPGHVVLDEFSLRIPPGRVVALCGPSGGGKSTVAALLERFYDAEEGQISIDGQDIRSLDPRWLRGRAIGFISQEPVLFHTTIKENIRYGKTDATDEQVFEAARLANAHAFVTSFPHGYDTVVGERGVTLSGGQKQRIAIARALLKNPSILILDEATSALDAESERLVQEALDRVGKGRTVLVIAHRLSTVQNADLIAVIANKRVAEIGTHQELLDRKGVYWQLVKYQQQVPQVQYVDDAERVDVDYYQEEGPGSDIDW